MVTDPPAVTSRLKLRVSLVMRMRTVWPITRSRSIFSRTEPKIDRERYG